MYQSYWGIKTSPFRGCLAPEFFYQSPTHEEAIARLHFLVDQQRRLGLLIGPGGSGKSLLLEVFASQIRRCGGQVALISLLGLQNDELLWQLATAWGLSPRTTTSLSSLWRLLTDRLLEYRYQQSTVVALFDDVHQAVPETLTHVTRLARWDASPEMRMTLVMAGRPEGIRGLDPSLLDLSELRVDVEPWEPADTRQFVTKSLAQVGSQSPVFAEPAIAKLHELAHGIPRRVSQLADLALLAGAGQHLQQINADVVEMVCQELGTAVS